MSGTYISGAADFVTDAIDSTSESCLEDPHEPKREETVLQEGRSGIVMILIALEDMVKIRLLNKV